MTESLTPQGKKPLFTISGERVMNVCAPADTDVVDGLVFSS